MINIQKTTIISCLTLFCFGSLMANSLLIPPPNDTLLQRVYINEIMAANDLILDEFGEADDWIEIYNGNTETLSGEGLYFTDDIDDLQKWQVPTPSSTISNGFGIVWADGTPTQGGFHTNFKLKSSGEFIAIVQELNGSLYILDSLTFPATPNNISYGRIEDGANEWVFFGNPSPNFSNNGQPQYLNDPIIFSEAGGHFPNAISLGLSVTNPAATIRYTLDGSTPTAQSPLYQNPISITSTTNVNARAFIPGFVELDVQTQFYVINEPAEIAILNIQSDPTNFWDNETGIYVSGTNGTLNYCNDNVRNWNQDWERPCQLTLLEPDGTIGFNVNGGMKIGGACSKDLKMKTFNFFMRSNTYGDELIDYQLFPSQDIDEYRRFKVRNSGTDWQEMLFRDGMNQTILSNTVDLDLMAYRPVRVYLNGEYWGIYGIREMFNKEYIASHHGVDKDSVDILGDPYGPRFQVRDGDDERWDEMMNFINNNSLSNINNYETVREFIDVKEYINYHIAQIYFANYDWPGNNVRVWRDQNGGKFRWMLFDTDASTGWNSWGSNVGSPFHNTLAHTLNTAPVNMWVPGFTEWPNGAESTYLFRKMIESDAFKNEFVQRTCTFRELIFAPDRVLPMVDNMKSLLAPEMERHILKWLGNGNLGSGTPSGGSVFSWNARIQDFKDFYEDRSSFILLTYAGSLNLSGRFNLGFGYNSNTNGKVVLHENEMEIPFDYTGEYFKDMPIKIKAIPNEGFYFSHWLETGNTNAAIDFVSATDQTLTPIFTDEAVAIENLESTFPVTIYPNPAQDQFVIDLPSLTDQVSLTLYDVYGKIIFEKEIFQINTTVSVANIPSGIYFIEIETKKGSITKRVLKN